MKRRSFAGACLLLVACSSGLEEHEALWRDKGPSSYQYTHGGGGLSPHIVLRVTVQSRAVTGTMVVDSAGLSGPFTGWTMEQLFDDIRDRLDGACKTTARYDESLGYPLSVYSDCGEEGDGWSVTDFAPGKDAGSGSG